MSKIKFSLTRLAKFVNSIGSTGTLHDRDWLEVLFLLSEEREENLHIYNKILKCQTGKHGYIIYFVCS